MKIFLFGNGNLSLDDFLRLYRAPLEATEGFAEASYLVCDFRGADTLAMEYLKHLTARVSVYHMGQRPRYLPDRFKTQVGGWSLVGGFASDAARDLAAMEACTHFLAHDFNTSPERKSGTLRNIQRCLQLGRVRL